MELRCPSGSTLIGCDADREGGTQTSHRNRGLQLASSKRAFAWARNRLIEVVCGAPVVFHHVPKCGGTSIARKLRVHYALSFAGFPSEPTYAALESLHPGEDDNELPKRVIEFREIQLLYYLFCSYRCLSGHVRFSNVAFDKFSQSYKFITTLREPVNMLISSYFYDSKQINPRWKVEDDIESYLEGPRARIFGAIYSHFFSGLPHDNDPCTRESVDLAKENLSRFAAVGLVEDMAGFERKLREVLGIRLRIGHENRSRVSDAERREAITPVIRRKIEELSAPNIEIYEFAKRHLAS